MNLYQCEDTGCGSATRKSTKILRKKKEMKEGGGPGAGTGGPGAGVGGRVGGSSAASGGGAHSFGDFMKAYETRKAKGAEGVTLLSGATSLDENQRDGGFFSGLLSGGPQIDTSSLSATFSTSFETVSNSLGSTIQSIGSSSAFDNTPLASLRSVGAGAGADLEAGGEAKGQETKVNSSDSWSSFSRAERFKGFMFLLALSGFFFLLSSFFFPVVLIFPAKFAFSYTLGSVFFMAAFVFVKGPKQWLHDTCGTKHLPFILSYYGSILGTLYACFFWKRYIIIMFFSWLQVVSIVYYAANNIPGGRMGLRLMYSFAVQFIKRVLVPCVRTSASCISRVFT